MSWKDLVIGFFLGFVVAFVLAARATREDK